MLRIIQFLVSLRNMGVAVFVLLLCAALGPGVWSKKHGHEKHHHKADQKIVGGDPIGIEKAYYQVYLVTVNKDYKGEQCGGCIIGFRTIMTAAHCFKNDTDQVLMRIGSDQANSGGTQYTSRDYVVHPQYDVAQVDYDYAIVRLDRDMDLDGVTAGMVKLPPDNVVPADLPLLVTGWGETTEGGNSSEQLLAITVYTISDEKCRKMQGGLTDRMFCAGVEGGGHDHCRGDSGGPAVGNCILYGTVSYGYGCGSNRTAGVYAKLGEVLDWIHENSYG